MELPQKVESGAAEEVLKEPQERDEAIHDAGNSSKNGTSNEAGTCAMSVDCDAPKQNDAGKQVKVVDRCITVNGTLLYVVAETDVGKTVFPLEVVSEETDKGSNETQERDEAGKQSVSGEGAEKTDNNKGEKEEEIKPKSKSPMKGPFLDLSLYLLTAERNVPELLEPGVKIKVIDRCTTRNGVFLSLTEITANGKKTARWLPNYLINPYL